MSCYTYNGNNYTESELREILAEERYIQNDTGVYTDDLLSLGTQEWANPPVGYLTKLIAQKNQQLNTYQKRLIAINKERNLTTTSQGRLTELNKQKRDIEKEINGIPDLGQTGLKDEIINLTKNADTLALGYYIEKDLERLERLVSSPIAEDLFEAQRIIKFYDLAGTFESGVENPFFEQEDIFLTDDTTGKPTAHYRLTEETMNQYREWRNKAIKFKNILNTGLKEATVNIINSSAAVLKTYGEGNFSFEELTSQKTGLKDAHWFDMWTMDITQGIFSKNGTLPQAMFSYLTTKMAEKLEYSKEIDKKIDDLSPKVIERLGELRQTLNNRGILGLHATTYQLFKEITKDGNETGGIIQKFNKEYFDSRAKATNEFQIAYDSAKAITDDGTRRSRRKTAFNNYRTWKRNHSIIIEMNKLDDFITDTEFAPMFSGNTNTEYKKYLIGILGEKEYTNQIVEQKKLLRKYVTDRQSVLDTFMENENVTTPTQLSERSQMAYKRWQAANSPIEGVKDYYNVSYSGHLDSFGNYNVFIPRKHTSVISKNQAGTEYIFNDSNTLTEYYNQTYEQFIENDSILSEFHSVLMDAIENIREVTPDDLRAGMRWNSFPAIMKTSSEIIADKAEHTSLLRRLFEAFQAMWEKLRLQFGVVRQSETSLTSIDPATGKANYKVNDQFLQGNQRAIKEKISIEVEKFLQSFNANTLPDQRLEKVTRFTTLDVSRFSPDSLALLADYLNIDITTTDLRAGNISKIVTRTGKQVDIGRIIRDYAIHSVVQSQSFDLARVAKYSVNMAMLYAARNEALPMLEVMKNYYDNIKAPKTNNLDKPIFNITEESQEFKGIRENATQQMEDWFGRAVLDNYGLKHKGEFHLGKKDSLIGKTIYSKEERNKIKEIEELISKLNPEKDIERIERLQKILDGLGKTRTTTALFDNMFGWIRILRLGFSIPSAITNFLEGFTSNMIIAAGGEYFNSNEIYYAYGVARQSFIRNLSFGKLSTPQAKKTRVLMDNFRVLINSANELQRASVRTYSDKLEWLNYFALNQRVEFLNQSVLMIATLRSLKITDKDGKSSSLWDAYTPEGTLRPEFRTDENVLNWEKLGGQDYRNFSEKLNKAIVLAHGNYDQLRGMMLKSNTTGRAVAMFKTWIPQQLYWRFAVEQDDLQAGTVGFKGRYRSYGKGSGAIAGTVLGTALAGPFGALVGGAVGIGMGFYNASRGGTDVGIGLLQESLTSAWVLIKKMFGMPINAIAGRVVIGASGKEFDSWIGKGTFTKQDANALKSNMSDIAMQLMWIGLLLIVKSIFWDDEDETKDTRRKAHNILANRLMQLSSQGSMYVNVYDLYGSTIGQNAVIQYLGDVGKELHRVNEFLNGRDIIQSGINEGESGLWNQTSKTLLPGIFKDNMLGFNSQAERQFQTSPFDSWFYGDKKEDKDANKRERADRRYDMREEGVKEEDIDKILNEELPTPARLKKLGISREEYRKSRNQ